MDAAFLRELRVTTGLLNHLVRLTILNCINISPLLYDAAKYRFSVTTILNLKTVATYS